MLITARSPSFKRTPRMITGLLALLACAAPLAGAEPRAKGASQESLLRYSVAVASLSSLNEALALQGRLSTPETPYYIVPVLVRGAVYFRVLAGLFRDRQDAEALNARLIDAGTKQSAGNWDIRPSGLAFGLGIYASEAEARARAAELGARGVPAYSVPAARDGRGAPFYVYAGGYENSQEAAYLEAEISRLGLNAPLVDRMGLEPAEAARMPMVAAEPVLPPPVREPVAENRPPPPPVEPDPAPVEAVGAVDPVTEPITTTELAAGPPQANRSAAGQIELGVDVGLGITGVDNVDDTGFNFEVPLPRIRAGFFWFGDRLALEPSLLLTYESFGDSEQTDLLLALALAYHLGGDVTKMRPFIEGAGLFSHSDDGTSSSQQLGIAGGVGLKLPAAGGRMAFRLEALLSRFFETEDDAGFTTLAGLFGISFLVD